MGERGERAVVTAWTRGRPRSPFREVSLGIAINDRNWVIANAWDRDDRPFSLAWNLTTGVRVRLPGGPDDYVEAVDINDRNVIVGTSGLHAAIWRLRRR
jgi:hypothetical protein